MLKKNRGRYELAEKAVIQAPKVLFNNVFSEVSRDTELLAISKYLNPKNFSHVNKPTSSTNIIQ